MLNKILISLLVIFSFTILFTGNHDRSDFSDSKKITLDNKFDNAITESMKFKLMEYDKKKINSMKLLEMDLMEKNLLNKKKSNNQTSKFILSEKERLSKKMSSPPIKNNNSHFINDYRLEKLVYMKTHNLNSTHQPNNSTEDKQSLIGIKPINTNNRDCSDCVNDYTNEGSECCDSAWEEYGLTCEALASLYNWDCSGCVCPGDGEPECDDGYCTGDETYENCPEDCVEPNACEVAGGFTPYISDAWCDIGEGAGGYDNNIPECDFDGGDCCPCTCEDYDGNNDGIIDTYCSQWGGDCDDCADAQDAGEICPAECSTCEDEGLVECSDGSCAAAACFCPQPDCEECFAQITCPDGSCAAAACFCPQPDCEECLGQITCWDGSCAYDLAGCPEEPDCPEGQVADCADEDCCSEAWIGDGLCDGEDQSWGCDLTCYANDGGDCGPACSDGEVECWDNTCAASDEECTPTDCSNIADWDTCALYVELYGYTCQDMENDFGYDCSYVEECGMCPWICEDDGLLTCWDNSCVEDLADCPEADCTEAGGIESWIADGYCDNSNNNSNCDWDGGDCCGSTCLVSNFDCVGNGEGSYGACYNECLDPDGNDDCCIDDTCPFTCEGNDLITCTDGTCADEACNCPQPDCNCSGEITCWDGSCATSEEDCNGCENPVEAVVGTNFSEGYDEFYSFTITEGGFLTLSTAGAEIDTKLYLFANCEDAATFDDFDTPYIAYNDDWGSSQYGVCPDCTYWGESYIYVGVPAADYIIVSSDTYNSAHVPFEWTLAFEVGIEGCTNPTADNYDPEANVDDGSCEFPDGSYFVNCDGGSYPTEVSWDLVNENTTEIVLSGGAPFESIIALDPGTYYLNAMDSWGDGWNGNIWMIVDAESNELLSYTLETGTDGMSESFVVDTNACENTVGDVNSDGVMNILDIGVLVNHVLGFSLLEGCALEAADYNEDGNYNVFDIVAMANVILDADGGGRVNVDDASSVKIIQMDDKVLMNANGYVGAIQMSLQHGSDFEINLTQKALLASFNTIGNETKLIIVAPESDELFSYGGEVEIVEIIAANSEDYIDVVSVPAEFALHSAYPNPFNPVTTISFLLPTDSDVLIQVVNLYGRVVETLTNSNMNSGYHSVRWNADSHSSGLYFVKMVAGDYHQTQKLMLVK